MRTLIWFASFWVTTLYKSFHILKIKSLMKKGLIVEKRNYAYKIAQQWAKNLIFLTGSKVKIIGLENIPTHGAVLFASNHQGNFDIPLLLSNLPCPVGFVAKIELKKLPIVSTWMKLLECVFIDRKDIRQSLRTISEATEILKSGQSMVIFPEGTRSKSHEMDAFKPGSLKLATKAGVPVIPVTISGSYKIMESNNNKIKPAHVKIIISKPINPTELDKSTDLTVTVFNSIKENLKKYPS